MTAHHPEPPLKAAAFGIGAGAAMNGEFLAASDRQHVTPNGGSERLLAASKPNMGPNGNYLEAPADGTRPRAQIDRSPSCVP